MPGLVKRWAMRPRRVVVQVHRWLSIGMFAWLAVIAITGAWLVVHHSVESWIHSGRYERTSGDVGPDRALATATAALPDRAEVYGVVLPGNGRGVYQVGAELAPADPNSQVEPEYLTAFVDPGSGQVNGVRRDSEGATAWLYRGHEFLWQDHGLFGAFDPASGWCRADARGHEPGGAKGVVCDVLPDGQDMVGFFALGFVVVLLTGCYLWYWPGVRRWATALVVRRGRGRFALHLSVHKLVGLLVWLPLTVIAFTGAAFAFPNIGRWFDNATPARRDFDLWSPPEGVVSAEANGRDPIGMVRAVEVMRARFPDRTVNVVMPPSDETGMYTAWVSRGFDPWTREGGAGNVLVGLDQYSGRLLYDGRPDEGNVADQLWDDWSFPLHTGDFGGTATRVLWVGVGLSPLVLGATGLTMQLTRRGKRRRAAPRPDDGVPSEPTRAVEAADAPS